MAKLGNYIEQIRGVSYKPEDVCASTDVDAVAILRANNIQDDGLIFDDLVYVKKDKVSAKQYIQKGDIVVCASSGSKNLVGKAAIVNEDMEISFGAFCKVIRPKKLMPSYIGHYFQSPKYRNKISELAGGANINNIRNEHIDDLDIVVPNTDEQERISIELNKVGGLISLRKQQLSKLDELVKSRFIELFGDPVENDHGWQTQPLESVCKTIVDCPHSTPSYTDEDTGYMCIRTSIVKKNRIMWDEIEYIPEHEYYQRIQRKRPEKGDVVYTREGAILGIAAMIDRECNVALGQRSMLLSPNTAMCLPKFLSAAMNFESFLRKALGGVSGSASPHINVGDIKAFAIILPPMELQEQFAAFVEQTDKSKFEIQKSLEKLETLKKALMQKYFG